MKTGDELEQTSRYASILVTVDGRGQQKVALYCNGNTSFSDIYSGRRAPPRVERELVGQFGNFSADAVEGRIVIALLERLRDPGSNLAHLRLLHAARGECRRAHADAGGLEGRIRIPGNRVLVHRDPGLAQCSLGVGAENALLEDIDEHEVIVRTARDQPEAGCLQTFRKSLRVRDDLRGIGAKLRTQRLAQSNGLSSDNVHQWTTLLAREDGLVDSNA